MQRFALPGQSELHLEVNTEDQRTLGPCACCGEMSSCIWGYAYRSDVAVAAYFVEWTPQQTVHDTVFDFIIGRWGEETSDADRRAVSVALRRLDSGPAFMVQNARKRSVASSPLVSSALDRDAVIGTTLADEVFALCDLIYLADPRLTELRG